MAYKVYKNSDTTAAYVVEIVADKAEDIETLPTEFTPGSTCLCIEDSSVWVFGNDKEWHQL